MTAWASQQSLVLGQVKVEDHSNEITAIPALLELLDVEGAIITLDAMGTQTKIIKQIREKKADYIVTLKANHPTLFSEVKQWFTEKRASNFEGIDHDYHSTVEKSHHRTVHATLLFLEGWHLMLLTKRRPLNVVFAKKESELL